MRLPVLLFDVDLTLVDTGGAGRAAMRWAFAASGLPTEPLERLLYDGRTDRAIFREALARVGLGGAAMEEAYDVVVERYLERLPAELEARDGRVLPGVPDVLARCRAFGYRVGLATGNFRRGAERKLSHFGLWEAFAGGGFGDDTEVRADLVAAALRELGHAGAAAWVIGDTPRDVEAAHAAGARAIAVATGRYSTEELAAAGAEIVLPDLSELVGRLDELAAQGS